MNKVTNDGIDFQVNLTNCDREPIHIPGLVQKHGVLLALDDELVIQQISANCSVHFGKSADALLNRSLENLLDKNFLEYLKEEILPQVVEANPVYLSPVEINDKIFETIVHRFQDVLILEFEHPISEALKADQNVYSILRSRLSEISRAETIAAFCGKAAETVRTFTGFDRVMIYRFQEDESGHVIAEAKREDLETLLNLHYPASDIPKQARVLYVKQPLRFAVNVDAPNSPLVPPLNPETNQPLDMSYAATRAMSPIHIEYLQNMGVAASMSISIVRDEKLWGLIACHHHSPRYIPHQTRMVGEFIAHSISLQAESKTNAENFEYISRLKDSHQKIVEELTNCDDIPQCLIRGENNILSTVEADGAALILDDEVYLLGQTPERFHVKKLVEWLWKNHQEEIFETDKLSTFKSSAEEYADVASGVLAVRLTSAAPEYIIWFRAEHAHSVRWAGNPEKPVTVGKFGERLTPRKSFEVWKQEIRQKSKPWKPFEIEFAKKLRRSIVEMILRHVEQLRSLNRELEASNTELDSFAYVASHDLKEPLRGISNYSNFLLEDYGERLDEQGIERLQTLVRLTDRMENLLDSLLHYSRVGRLDLDKREISLDKVLQDTLILLHNRIEENNVRIILSKPLPNIEGDETRTGEIFSNLISNAIKYNNQSEKIIEIGYLENSVRSIADEKKTELIFYVRDNGIGIDKRHFNDVFRIFKRLHGRNEYSGGVGAGLTIVKKIVERHNGRIWLESVKGEGTTFYFTLQ